MRADAIRAAKAAGAVPLKRENDSLTRVVRVALPILLLLAAAQQAEAWSFPECFASCSGKTGSLAQCTAVCLPFLLFGS